MNLIDRDKIPNYQIYGTAKVGDIEQPAEMRIAFWSDIAKMPVVSPENCVVHGRWILEREPNGKPYCFHCSVCDDEFRRIGITEAYPYCPYCAAKMDLMEQSGV